MKLSILASLALAALATLGVQASAQVVNDDCTGAVALTLGPNGPFDSTLATVSASPGPFTCGFSVGGDLWFTYTAANTNTVVFDTCLNTGFDTVMELFDGSSCAALNLIQCNDDSLVGTPLSDPGPCA